MAVAVSGGADSMTLLSLAHDWAAETGATLTALTVDHGLRPEAGAEAAQVAAWCKAHGIAHQTLVWTGDKPDNGLQAAARDARYTLLHEWCHAQGHTELLVAHSQNDQAETYLMRMSRGSGIDGLAAMPLVSDRNGVRLIRPLLTVSRARIEATTAVRSLATVSDPSNRDRRYARVRVRRVSGQSPSLPVISRSCICKVMRRLPVRGSPVPTPKQILDWPQKQPAALLQQF
ncbi:MAG: tRNA lysidine(34) synthetase TilS [Alphaproteobacteria bacterium]